MSFGLTHSIRPILKGAVKTLKRIAFKVAHGREQLDRVRELDRNLTKLTHMRERALGLLSQSFIESPMAENPPTEFQWVMTEIRNIEKERSQPSRSSNTPLSALVVPPVGVIDADRENELELVSAVERAEIYRRRLRGLYLDLAEMILSHRLSEHFPIEIQHLDEIQARLTQTREMRQNVQATLPASEGVFSAAKIFVTIAFVVFTLWVLF